LKIESTDANTLPKNSAHKRKTTLPLQSKVNQLRSRNQASQYFYNKPELKG